MTLFHVEFNWRIFILTTRGFLAKVHADSEYLKLLYDPLQMNNKQSVESTGAKDSNTEL